VFAVEQSNARLFSTVTIAETDFGAGTNLARQAGRQKIPPVANGISEEQNGSSASTDREECVTNLVAEGQSLARLARY